MGEPARPNSLSRKKNAHQRGFTLVEMIAVMVLLSFGLIAGSQLFSLTAQSYRDTSVRTKLTQDGRFAIERISRELREALPGSVRTSVNGTTQCIEWLPIAAASRYLSLPTTSTFPVMEIDPDLPATGTAYFAVVFPVSSSVYSIASSNPLSSPPLTDIDTNTDRVNLVNAPAFTGASPADRIFFVTYPVALCANASGRILRFNNYGFVAQSVVPTLTGGVPLVENLLLTEDGTTVNIFDFSDATLTRNSMLQLDIRMRDPSTQDVMRLRHTVFIRNVP